MGAAVLSIAAAVIILGVGWWMSKNLSYDKFLDDQIKRDLGRKRAPGFTGKL